MGFAVCGSAGLTVEGRPGDPAGAVMGLGLVEFESAEVWGFAGEVAVDVG